MTSFTIHFSGRSSLGPEMATWTPSRKKNERCVSLCVFTIRDYLLTFSSFIFCSWRLFPWRERSDRERHWRERSLILWGIDWEEEGAERPRAPLARAVAHFRGEQPWDPPGAVVICIWECWGGSRATASALGASGRSFYEVESERPRAPLARAVAFCM